MARKTLSVLLTSGVLAVAGLVATGVVWQGAAVANDDAAKRDEDTADLILVADADDDDTNNLTRDTDQTVETNTGNSRSTNDNTNSRFTAVSRDRDVSRSDKTKDWTRDGGTLTRDHSANHTNDSSRNDTRR